MAAKIEDRDDDIRTMLRNLLIEAPLAAAKLPLGDSKELGEALWKSYDAWVRLTTNSINSIYSLPVVGEVVGNSLKRMLQLQRYSNALSGAFFAGLWPSLGLPSAAEFQALRAEVQSLAEELHRASSALEEEQFARRAKGRSSDRKRLALAAA